MSQGFAFFGTGSVLGADCVPHSRQFSFPVPHICSSFKAAKATADGERCVRVQHPKMCPRGPALPAQLAAPCRGEADFIILWLKGAGAVLWLSLAAGTRCPGRGLLSIPPLQPQAMLGASLVTQPAQESAWAHWEKPLGWGGDFWPSGSGFRGHCVGCSRVTLALVRGSNGPGCPGDLISPPSSWKPWWAKNICVQGLQGRGAVPLETVSWLQKILVWHPQLQSAALGRISPAKQEGEISSVHFRFDQAEIRNVTAQQSFPLSIYTAESVGWLGRDAWICNVYLSPGSGLQLIHYLPETQGHTVVPEADQCNVKPNAYRKEVYGTK